ncbi:MAG TPA: hypothetical protein VGW75_09350 [Solirubrobacteraceae bacterium]|nr:hypothetical protein [Solirubrobacteraceae bacterium]
MRGPFALISIRGVERRPASSFEPEDGRLAGTKFPAALRAGHSAVVRIAEPDQAHAALLVRAATREARSLREGDVAVRYVPCRPDTPRFGGRGSVGPTTGWAGALIVTGPRCVTLELTVDGRRRRDVRLRLGARCR